jgi:hypothetical protein
MPAQNSGSGLAFFLSFNIIQICHLSSFVKNIEEIAISISLTKVPFVQYFNHRVLIYSRTLITEY